MSNYVALPTRTSADVNSSADVNQLQTNIKATRDEWIGAVYAITADYTITDTDGYGKILVNSTSGDIKVTLPTLADNQNRVITVVATHSGGRIEVDGEGAETINGASSMYLQGQYDRITVVAQSSEWSIISYKAHYDTGWINCSDWTNRHLGTSAFDYDNLVGAFTVGEVVTEAVSGNTGIIQIDTGSTLTVKNVTGTGIWTDGRGLTGGTSGATADVNEGGGSNKNQDTNIYHAFGVNQEKLNFKIYVSTDKTEANTKTFYVQPDSDNGGYGAQVFGVDTNYVKIQNGSAGMLELTDTGVTNTIDTEDWYYKIVAEVTI